MKCAEARPLFPAYLEGDLTGSEMQAVSEHQNACAECGLEYKKLENTRLLVSSLGRKTAPADLSLRIKVALSRERSRTWRNLLMRYAYRLEDALNAMMVPATAGVLTAVIFFGTLIGFFRVPARADAAPAPAVYKPARLQPPQTAMSSTADTDLSLEDPVMVRAYIDATGRVQDYQIIAGPDNEEVRSQLNRALLFTTFSPAYAFGRPVAGEAVVCFSHVNVKG